MVFWKLPSSIKYRCHGKIKGWTFFCLLPASVKSDWSLKNIRRSRIKSRAAKEKLAMEFIMNITFSNNSNNNADGFFKLHKYTEVFFFFWNCTTMGNYPLITGIAIRVSSFVAVILHEFLFSVFVLFCFLDNRSDRCSTVRYMYVERYDQTHNDRFCPVYYSGMIEDDFHFLFHCPKYSIPRENSIIKSNTIFVFHRIINWWIHRIFL